MPTYRPTQVQKALYGAVVAGLGAVTTAATDGHITLWEWLVAAGATWAAAGIVFQVPNAPK